MRFSFWIDVVVSLCIFVYVVVCVEIPAWKVFDQDIYFKIVDPSEIGYYYRASPAKNFGRGFNKYFEHTLLVVADPISGCTELLNLHKIPGNFVMVERGECSFVEKIARCEEAGAVGVIVYDNNPDNRSNLVAMIDDDRGVDITIPSLFIVGSDGFHIRRALERNFLESAIINVPINMTYVPEHQIQKPPWTKIL